MALASVVATLGPMGTDAHAEAQRHFDQVILTDTFSAAVEAALQQQTYALVAAGFVERDGAGVITRGWVDLHFRVLGRLEVADTWMAPTKQMCLASHPAAGVLRSVALHPATQVFADTFAPAADRRYVDAKPAAVQLAARGEVDGCIGSVDVATQAGLTVREVFEPTMV
ncbi:hypothetical protein [Streptomyces virginiae]|uniref:hypothetical protein n=1 Tax=Streptomyces virginiae TaxID=1961 RepID=UPI00224E44F4|nr:hypothetical protein [Streptomyces virginiae]MCX5174287.1 hypothetical protein [Streptomyces virginiae]